MAASAAARRIALHSIGNAQADLDSQLAASHRFNMTTRASATTPIPTPRPSISPLSVSAPTHSHIANDTAAMLVRAAHTDGELDVALQEPPDDGSSSLSEPDDDQDDDEEEEREEQEAEEEEQDVEAEGQLPRVTLLGIQHSLEVDSEAETERLDQMTPQKLRDRADSVSKTPSKLIRAATLDDDLSDPPSPLAGADEVGAASSTSTLDTAGKKRKRSSATGDSPLTSPESDLGESPRKRSHSSIPDDVLRDYAGKTPAREGVEDEDAATETLVEELPNPDRTLPPITKGIKGRKGKFKGKKQKPPAVHGPEDDAQPLPPPEDSPTEDSTAKAEEDAQRKAVASTFFSDLAKHFASYRDALYHTRLAALDAELVLLQPQTAASAASLSQTCQQQQEHQQYQHPEYLRQLSAVTARHDKHVREAHAAHFYRTQNLRQRALADRTLLHSEYFQHIREVREQALDELSATWYQIQRERRLSLQRADDEEGGWLYRYDPDRTRQIIRQAKYNREVSVLSGFAKYVGFPAAPEMEGPRADGLENDFRAMKIPIKRPVANHPQQLQEPSHQPSQQSHQHHHGSVNPTSLASLPVAIGSRLTNASALCNANVQADRQAEHQFMQLNAWARPQALPPPAASAAATNSDLVRPGLSPLLALHRDAGGYRNGVGIRDISDLPPKDASTCDHLSGARETFAGGLMTHTDDWAETPISGARGLGRVLAGARIGEAFAGQDPEDGTATLGWGAEAGVDGEKRSPLPVPASFPPMTAERTGNGWAAVQQLPNQRREEWPRREGPQSNATIATMTTMTMANETSSPGLAIAKQRLLHAAEDAQTAENNYVESTGARNFSGRSGASTIDAPLAEDENETMEQQERVRRGSIGDGEQDVQGEERGVGRGIQAESRSYALPGGGHFWAPALPRDAAPLWGTARGPG